jgi:Leucine-rich repeat (LRR) protein
LSRLENLETLDLRYNNFDDSIIESLSSVKSLKNLNLASNDMGRSFIGKGMLIFCITSKHCKLYSFFFFFFKNRFITGSESLSRLENLETLDLSNNNFDDSIIVSLSSVKSLKNLNLALNDMGGFFPDKGMLIFCITSKHYKLHSFFFF